MSRKPDLVRDSLARISREVIECERCPRLRAHCATIAREKRRAYRDEDYWGRPVPGFGDPAARLVIVGLAPGAHGSNRTGRMFTGDTSGESLYSVLHRAGFASRPESRSRDDGLALLDAWITAVGRCAPPGNRPTPEEIRNCRPFLLRELRCFSKARVMVLLGKIAFDATLASLRELGYETPRPRPEFAHGLFVPIANASFSLLASYHPSRQNTNTGRLTTAMLDAIFSRARAILESESIRRSA